MNGAIEVWRLDTHAIVETITTDELARDGYRANGRDRGAFLGAFPAYRDAAESADDANESAARLARISLGRALLIAAGSA